MMRARPVTVLLLLCAIATHAQVTRNYQVILRSNFGSTTMWDGNVLDIYGFAPTLADAPVVPGYTIYAEEGDSVIITARSVSQIHHHTIHLHGLDVDTRNDGDPATSFSLSHMQDTTYTFVARHAGTYIYHCHVGDVVHVQMGMYASVKVKGAGGANTAWTGGPTYDRDYGWLMSEMDEDWHDNPPVHDDSTDTVVIPPYEPNYFLINGKSETQLPPDSAIVVRGAVNERIYLRLTNIGFNDNRITFPASLHAQVIDSDGRPLPNAVDTDTLEVSPGERYGVMLTPDAEFNGTIQVQYIDLNTGIVLNTQTPPVIIEGFVGVNGPVVPEFSVHPVPASGPLYVDCPSIDGRSRITLYDARGAAVPVIHPAIITPGHATLNISGIASGTYYLQLQCGEKLFAERIVVE